MKGLVLVLLAVGSGIAYYSGALNPLIAGITSTITSPTVRRVIRFPGGVAAGGSAGSAGMK